MQTFQDGTEDRTYWSLSDKLRHLREEHGAEKPGQPVHEWLDGLREEGHVVLLTPAQARDPRTFRSARDHAHEKDALLVWIEPPASEPDSPVVTLSRAQAKDPEAYRIARAEATKRGAQVAISEE